MHIKPLFSLYTALLSSPKMSNKHLASTNGGQPPLASEESKYASATDLPLSTSAPGATTSNGLELLFAASQVETKKTAERADVKADSAEEVPSTITVVSNGTGTAEAESESACNSDEEEGPSFGHDETKKPTIDGALKDQKVKTFPQILQDILNTPEYESIAHWLPDGLSFIIADKQRFSNEILPKYFRRALFHSFIRKLNRYGFRRVKGSCKGEESSFAHNNFVRDKPLLCLKMSCKSKPSFSYHKGRSLRRPQQTADATSIAMAGNIVAPAPALPFFVGARGVLDSGSSLFATTTTPLLPAATIGPPTTTATIAAAAAIEERQIVASMLADHYSQQKQQSVLRERQMHMLQMRRRQVQLELLRLQEKSAYDEGHAPGSYDSYIQSCMMAQSHDILPRNFFH